MKLSTWVATVKGEYGVVVAMYASGDRQGDGCVGFKSGVLNAVFATDVVAIWIVFWYYAQGSS